MHEQFEQLFDKVPCFLSVQGPDLLIQRANRAFREEFGPSVGKHCYRVFKGRDEPCLVCPALMTFEDGQTREHEEVVETADGRRISVRCTTMPIVDSDGTVTAVFEMSTDITELRRIESQLTSISLLVGSISHGIRGLLTGLDGGIYMVNTGLEKENQDRVGRGWEMVQRNVSRLRSMVLDIIYYARDRDLILEEIDAANLMREIQEGLRKRAGETDVELLVDAPAGVGVFHGDLNAIRAALVNILENSLEACLADRGRTENRVRFSARRSPPWIEFVVEDDGIGMDPKTREKLFSPFWSAGAQATDLGLFISNKIIDKHGGSIEVESEPGRGARYVVLLPIEARPTTRPPGADDGPRSEP